MTARYIIGDVFDVLETLEPDSVDLVFSSPPFLALRSYLPADHPDKAKEIGSEQTPADFLDTLLDVVEACDRVLAPHGSLCFELGDTFAGSGGTGLESPDTDNQVALRGQHDGRGPLLRDRRRTATNGNRNRDKAPGWPLDKSLCLIPTLFAASLAYGRNLLRPERLTPPWRIRNLVVWARPNPPVGALGDKFRPATSYLTVATKSRTRYFDLDAVRSGEQSKPGGSTNWHPNDGRDARGYEELGGKSNTGSHPAGAPPLDYWVIPTAPYKGSHYATFPPDLVVKPVKAMTPQRVCLTCGEPSRRITERTPEYAAARAATGDMNTHATGKNDSATGNNGNSRHAQLGKITSAENVTLGWSDCGHDDWRPGVVLDPFAGSGTTLAVATGHGRDAIGIDIDERNAELARERVGPMFLTVEHLSERGVA